MGLWGLRCQVSIERWKRWKSDGRFSLSPWRGFFPPVSSSQLLFRYHSLASWIPVIPGWGSWVFWSRLQNPLTRKYSLLMSLVNLADHDRTSSRPNWMRLPSLIGLPEAQVHPSVGLAFTKSFSRGDQNINFISLWELNCACTSARAESRVWCIISAVSSIRTRNPLDFEKNGRILKIGGNPA